MCYLFIMCKEWKLTLLPKQSTQIISLGYDDFRLAKQEKWQKLTQKLTQL